ncbi:immunity 52 family protein [Xenorhabdus miraniensis]|uniref:Uncharacterized protein n=1 Tax=Xenorhabdus miraniensis TaxID=351674 RepID=A0A2D0JVY7_9GAMM|nr:immunity 52 family protein [Xenorhabdus miraniensis]PHM50529.1 hypothetical protein Xmir_00712 [Xenorhabdus miraniensis]
MPVIHPRIALFHDIKESVTPELALADTVQLMNQIYKISNNSRGWHLPGYSEEEIIKNNVFNKDGITEYALNEFIESYDKDDRTIIKSLFDTPDVNDSVELKNDITYICQDDVYSVPNRLGKSNISIRLNLDRNEFKFEKFIDFLSNLISVRSSPFLLVDTRGYSLKQKQVFPDRLYAGWMLYLPIEIDPTLLPMAEEIISVADKNGDKGSLIITTKEIFDIENQNHINKANDIEICLRDLQLLPLIAEI